MLIDRVVSLCVVCYIYVSVTVVADLTEDLMPVLYLKYKEAFNDGESSISIRRLSTNNKQYEIHVKRLKEVNGFKKHNLLVKETIRSNGNPLIYINNPVESKLPNPYLTLEEFKHALISRVKLQKDEFVAKRERILSKYTKTRIYATKSVSNAKFSKNINPSLLKTKNKVERSTSSTKGTVKQIKESTKNLLTKIEPTITTKHEFSKQTKVNNEILNIVTKNTSIQTSNETTPSIQETRILIERTATSTNKQELSKVFTEEYKTRSTTAEKSSAQPLNEASIAVVNIESDSTTFATISSTVVTDAIEANKSNGKEIVINETNALSINSRYPSSNSLTTLDNVTTAIYQETMSSTTKDITEFITTEVKKETPKRSTVSKKLKEKEKTTKSTKRKRSTLGRPMVFIE